MIGALSLATDFGKGYPLQCALRSCLLAVRLGEAIGFGEGEMVEVYYLALLRRIGCTTDAHVAAAVFGEGVAAGRPFATVDWGRPTDVLAGLVVAVASPASTMLLLVAGHDRRCSLRSASAW